MSAYTCTPVYTHAYMNILSVPREIGAYAQIDKCISVNTYGYSVVDAHIHFHACRHGTLLQLKFIGIGRSSEQSGLLVGWGTRGNTEAHGTAV